jgi:serine protease Do
LARALIASFWRNLVRAALAGAVVGSIGLAPANGGQPSEDIADLVEKLLPAVVNISTTQTIKVPQVEIPQFPPGSPFEEFFKEYFDRLQRQERSLKVASLGSGFIIDSAGDIVTANHVIREAEEITVILQDEPDRPLKAKILGRDSRADLALLKIDAVRPLPSLKWGDSDKARVGQRVIAIGNPFGLGGTVTAGILSARARALDAGPYNTFLQTDAAINKGSSGGPLLNMAGEVIGINTAILSPTGGSIGISFAIPSSVARPVVEQLRKFGHLRRGWIGIRYQRVTPEIAQSLGLANAVGALVASVTPGGPAETSGIKAGDVILRFDNKDIVDIRRLAEAVAGADICKTASVVVFRHGRTLELKVGVEELKQPAEAKAGPKEEQPGQARAGERSLPSLGLSLLPLTKESRGRYEIAPDVNGAVVTSVEPGGPAAEIGIRSGDVMSGVDGQRVSSADQVVRLVEAERRSGRKAVLLLIQRGEDIQFVAVPIRAG